MGAARCGPFAPSLAFPVHPWYPSRSADLMNPVTHFLEAGDVVALPGEQHKPYRVEYVNFSRAYCLPAYRVQVQDGGRLVDGEVTGPGINIAPNAHVIVVQDSRAVNHQNQNDPINGKINQFGTKTTMTTSAISTTNSNSTDHQGQDQQVKANGRVPRRPAVKASSDDLKALNDRRKAAMAASIGPNRTTEARALGTTKAGDEKATKTTTRAAKAAVAEVPAGPITPRVGCPRGADISHVGLSCDGSGAQVPAHRYFTPGMDARFKGWMLKVERGQMKLTDLPEVVRKSYQWEGVAGAEGADNAGQLQGYIATTNYKGEDNPRYVELLAEGRTMGPVDTLGRLKAKTGGEVAEGKEEAHGEAPKARGGRKSKQDSASVPATAPATVQ